MGYYIGLMSGTSMDGVDAAIVDVDNHHCIAAITRPYPEKTLALLKQVLSETHHSFALLSALNQYLGEAFAETAIDLLSQTGFHRQDIIAIGSHGQTLCHDAFANPPYTVQLGCGHTIASRTGITVVADFRVRDMRVGGQGAPFAPIYHQALFQHHEKPLAIVNIGGISNGSFLVNEQVTGYDLGPGNALMDAWVKLHLNQSYDNQGQWAESGEVIVSLLDKLLADPFFKRLGPKSIGKEYFSLSWLFSHELATYRPQDIQATLLELTARSIAEALLATGLSFKEILICGGGVHNEALMRALSKQLAPMSVKSSAVYNLNPDYIEAMIFAWLASKTLSSTPVNLMSITGSLMPCILGCIYP